MVNGDAGLEACNRRMIVAQPFLAHFQSAGDRCLVVKY